MAGRQLPGTTLFVRRGQRRDLAQLHALIALPAEARLERFLRRMLADLGMDIYVAEDGERRIVGVISVAYRRSLMRGGLSAILDGVRTRSAPDVLEALVAFAEQRARRRGCRRMTACVDADAELRAVLTARGYRAEALFVTDLAGAA
jgi:hypothetical protein